MRKGGGRAKGSRFELELAKTISVWWCQNESLKDKRAEELPFRRAPLSGGWDKKAAASDLIVTSPALLACPWPFALEAKNQEVWDWEGLFKNNDKWPVKAYWAQCCEAATQSNLRPLVLFTKNLSPIYFALESCDAQLITLKCLEKGWPTLPYVNVSWLPFVIGRFDDLLAMTPQQIVEGLKRDTLDTLKAAVPDVPAAPVGKKVVFDDLHHKELAKRLPKPVRDWPPLDDLRPILGTRR